MSHTRDSWAKYHISGEEKEDFEHSTDASNQPKFEKYTTRVNLEGFLSDNFGLMFGYTNTRSKIPLYAYTSSYVKDEYLGEKKNQRREINNYFLKGLWYATDRLTITPSIIYAPQENKVFHDGTLDSYQYYKSGGLTLNLGADYEFDFGLMKNKIGYSKLESSRDADNEYRYTWKSSNLKPWGNTSSHEGGFGDIEQTQKTFSYNLDFDFNEIEILEAMHKFRTGFEFKHTDANFEITNGFKQAVLPASLGGATCDANDIFCLNDDSFGGNGQYLRTLSVYNPGKINVKQKQWALYLEDEINIDRLTLRPGIRLSGDDYMDKKPVAPRFSASYDIFGDDTSVLNFGRNRYYGRNIFAYRLKDGQWSLLDVYRRGTSYTPDWTYSSTGGNTYNFHQLEIPYDDEISYGIKQKISDFELAFKYVKRKGRDQIITARAKDLGYECKDGLTKTCQTFTNGGYSDTINWNIAFKNLEPLKIYSSNHSFELSYEHSKTKSNARNYDVTETMVDKDVYYNGEIMSYGALPVLDYGRPWNLKLTTISQFPKYNLAFSNFFNLKGPIDAIVSQGQIEVNGAKYTKYEDVELGKSFSWDTRIGYTQKLSNNMNAFVNLDIYNILDKTNKATATGSSSTTLRYERGRQFWLEAGIKW